MWHIKKGLFTKRTAGESKEFVGVAKENTVIYKRETVQSYPNINFDNL